MEVYRLDSTEDYINHGTENLIYGKGISIIEKNPLFDLIYGKISHT